MADPNVGTSGAVNTGAEGAGATGNQVHVVDTGANGGPYSAVPGQTQVRTLTLCILSEATFASITETVVRGR